MSGENGRRMSIDNLVSRLDGVKETGHGKYIACCPAHEDRSPSLAIKEGDDGRVLLHCFAGCETEDVLTAIGLTFCDLYLEQMGSKHNYKRQRFDARQVLAGVSHEIMVVCLIADRLVPAADEPDQSRLIVAAARLNNALNLSQSIGTPPEIKNIRRGGS